MIEMMNLSSKYQPWIEARERFHLSEQKGTKRGQIYFIGNNTAKIAEHAHRGGTAGSSVLRAYFCGRRSSCCKVMRTVYPIPTKTFCGEAAAGHVGGR
jgi:hypothetical protein